MTEGKVKYLAYMLISIGGEVSGPGVMGGGPGTHDEHDYKKFPNGWMPRFGKTVGCGKGGIIKDRGRMFVCAYLPKPPDVSRNITWDSPIWGGRACQLPSRSGHDGMGSGSWVTDRSAAAVSRSDSYGGRLVTQTDVRSREQQISRTLELGRGRLTHIQTTRIHLIRDQVPGRVYPFLDLVACDLVCSCCSARRWDRRRDTRGPVRPTMLAGSFDQTKFVRTLRRGASQSEPSRRITESESLAFALSRSERNRCNV